MMIKRIIIPVIGTFLLVGCGGDGSIATGAYNPDEKDSINITISQDKNIERFSIKSGEKYSVDMLNSNKELLLVLSNTDHEVISKELSNNKSNNNLKLTLAEAKKLMKVKSNNDFKPLYKTTNSILPIDTEKEFVMTMDNNYQPIDKLNAKVKLVTEIDTNYGKKVLYLWVENGYYNCEGKACVNDTDLEYIKNNFLKDELNNDIYDYETNLFGEEYNNGDYTELINKTNEINLLFYPATNDNLYGYVNYKDFFNKTEINASNEMVLININSTLVNETYKLDVISTIAHEFQHIISFTKRAIEKNIVEDTWINEMRSEMIEDLLSKKLNTEGIRGVSYEDGSSGEPGNLKSILNYNDNSKSLVNWSSDIVNYANVASFGGYLLRKYNGGEILSKLMFSTENGMTSVEKETGKTFAELQEDWIFEQFSSNIEGNIYNTGTWKTTTYENNIYDLGSIDLFKLVSQIKLSENIPEEIENSATNIFSYGKNLTGKQQIFVPEYEENINVSLIIK